MCSYVILSNFHLILRALTLILVKQHENDKLNLKDKIMSELNANTEVFELLTNPISGDNPLIHILKSDNDEINSFRKRITKCVSAYLYHSRT